MADQEFGAQAFSRRPSEARPARRWDIVRVKAGKAIMGVMLGHDVVGAYTHWWGGRTVPCNGPDCSPCSKNVELRWHGYLPLYSLKTRDTSIVEFTEACVEVIDRWFSEHRTLRGCVIEIHRPGAKANGELRAKVYDGPLAKAVLPESPQVEEILMRMWGQTALKKRKQAAAAAGESVHISKLLPGQTQLPDEVYGPSAQQGG